MEGHVQTDNQRSEGDGHPLLQCTCCTKYAAETKSAVYGSKLCDGPGAVVATATAHAGSKVHLTALQHVATRLGSQGIVASMGRAVVATQKVFDVRHKPGSTSASRLENKKKVGQITAHVRSGRNSHSRPEVPWSAGMIGVWSGGFAKWGGVKGCGCGCKEPHQWTFCVVGHMWEQCFH